MKKAFLKALAFMLCLLMSISAIPVAALEELVGVEEITEVSDVSETSVNFLFINRILIKMRNLTLF